MGLLGDIGDFFTGGGDYADPKNIHPSYGVPMSDVRQAAINQLANMSAVLLAAGQPMSGAQRGQVLAQLGGAGSGFTTDLYNSSQRRLMQGQMQEKQAELQDTAALRAEIKQTGPEAFKAKYGIDPNGMSATDLRAALKQIRVAQASRDPLQQQMLQLQIENARKEQERNEAAMRFLQQRYGQPQPNVDGTGSPVAPVPPATPPSAAPPAEAPSPEGVPGGRSASNFRLPAAVAQTLLAGGMKPTEILKTEAELALKQDRWVTVPPGDNAVRRQGGFGPTQPLKIKLDASGNVIDVQSIGEDPNKAPANFRWTADGGRVEPIPGGPAEQIPAEVGARVGLARAFKPMAEEIYKALDDGKFDLNKPLNRAQLATNTGEMASFTRRMEIGKEALLRGLTGAGMNNAEAEQYATRFSIGTTDSPATIRDKLNLLVWSLDNVEGIVTRGRGDPAGRPNPPKPFGSESNAAPRVRRYNPETGKIE